MTERPVELRGPRRAAPGARLLAQGICQLGRRAGRRVGRDVAPAASTAIFRRSASSFVFKVVLVMLPSRPARSPRRPLPPPLALLSAALLLLSCRDSTGPGEGGALQAGREVSGTLSEADTADDYTIRAEAGQELVVWISAE